MRRAALGLGLLLLQRGLGAPGVPDWIGALWLPAVWLALAAVRERPLTPWEGLALGLGWDLLLEPVVGPGGIAWSAAAMVLARLARVVSARTVPVWAGAGAVAVGVVAVTRAAALAPLGLGGGEAAAGLLRTTVAVAVACAAVRGALALDLPGRWRTARSRRLR